MPSHGVTEGGIYTVMMTADAQALQRGRPVLRPTRVLVGALVLFGVFQVAVSVYRFESLQAYGFDLGYFEQVLWKISHGDWWAYSSIFQTPAVAADGSLALYPLAYLFRFAGGPLVLFVVQAVGTSMAAWGVYRAALALKLGAWTSVLGACLLLLAPGILGGSQFDYHPDFVALPFLVWAYVAYLEGRRTAYYLFALAAVFSKNIALVGFVGLGLGLIVYKRQWRDGLATLVGSLALIALEWGWLIPHVFHASSVKIDLSFYGYLGHGFLGILRGLVVHFPRAVRHVLSNPSYLVWVFGPLAGLSLLGSAALPAGLALVGLNAASAFANQQQFSDEYQVMLTGWLVLAALEGATRLARLHVGRRGWLTAAFVLTGVAQVAVITTQVVPTLNKPLGPAVSLEASLARVHLPADTVVWTQNRLGALLYRYRILGTDQEPVAGTMVDALPALWREAPIGAPTALVGSIPVTPYFATVLSEAESAGYRVSFHAGQVFVLRGTSHFVPANPSAVGLGYQPAARRWVIPAWTQATAVGRINWANGLLMAPVGRSGDLLSPLKLQLAPGRYQLRAVVHTNSSTVTGVLGAVRCTVLGQGAVSTPIQSALAVAGVTVNIRHTTIVTLSVLSYGRGAWGLGVLDITRVSVGSFRDIHG